MPLSLQTFSSIDDASAALKAEGARYLGGGTLVLRAVNEGDISIASYVRAIDPALSSIDSDGGRIRIGASVSMSMIARRADLGEVVRAARAVGGPAIRNMATVGGNLFAPAPYGDFAVALLALDATVHFGERDMPIGQFLLQRDKLAGGDIVTAVSFAQPAGNGLKFLKVSRVKPKGVSVLSIATMIEQDGSGAVTSARIALGCMDDRPMRAEAAEKALIGSKLTRDGIAAAVAAIGEGTDPITDPIASAWYRSEVLPVHFGRLLLG